MQNSPLSSSPPKIETRDLHFSFGSKRILEGINLSIPEKASMVLIGTSGCGKSVFLKCLLGLLPPTGGSIHLNGVPLPSGGKGKEEAQESLGMLFQSGALFDSLNVWRNVAFVPLQSMSPASARQVALENLSLVGLGEETAELFPAELSGGMRKRVALARAIAAKPEVLLFDEPTTGLDPITAAVIDRLIVRCVKEIGATAITVTHDMQSVQRIGDRVAMLHGGHLIWEGEAKHLEDSGDPRVDQFVKGAAEGPIRMARKAH